DRQHRFFHDIDKDEALFWRRDLENAFFGTARVLTVERQRLRAVPADETEAHGNVHWLLFGLAGRRTQRLFQRQRIGLLGRIVFATGLDARCAGLRVPQPELFEVASTRVFETFHP